MKFSSFLCAVLVAALLASAPPARAASPARQLKLLAPDRYLPNLPTLVRIEVIVNGQRDWTLWDGEALLSTDTPGVVLSTNRVVLRNGLGSALVNFTGGDDFNLLAALGQLQTNRLLHTATTLPTNSVGGVLFGASTTWTGIVLVTSDVLVQPGQTLTIQSNTIVLLSGVTNGTIANDIAVNGGTLLSLGTEAYPVTITCADSDLHSRWGQIRHNNAQPSLFQHTTITRGGRSTPEGNTGTAPVIRCSGSKMTFESCNITDAAEWSRAAPDFGTPGKILQSTPGSDLTFNNCLLARARVGPEIHGTALLVTNSYIVEMYGTNDSDALFLDAQQSGQAIKITGSVLADGDDDGIDTLGSSNVVENCIIRDWRNPFEDSKGISVENGDLTVQHCLLVDNALGISAKGSSGVTVRMRINQSTILSASYAVGATNKTGTTPVIDYRITNSILRGTSDSIFTQYNPSDIHLYYCNVGETWAGLGCNFADPMFVDAANHNYALRPYSPEIDSGDPSAPHDADGTVSDVGYFSFVVPPPQLSRLETLPDGAHRFSLAAYPNRNYQIQISTNLTNWVTLATIAQTNAFVPVTDAPTNSFLRFYRARLALP